MMNQTWMLSLVRRADCLVQRKAFVGLFSEKRPNETHQLLTNVLICWQVLVQDAMDEVSMIGRLKPRRRHDPSEEALLNSSRCSFFRYPMSRFANEQFYISTVVQVNNTKKISQQLAVPRSAVGRKSSTVYRGCGVGERPERLLRFAHGNRANCHHGLWLHRIESACLSQLTIA